MILRDWLAMDRTLFAGTRTFMDYIKTFTTLVIATIVFLAVFRGHVWDTLLYLGFMVAFILLVTGVLQFMRIRQHRRDLDRIERCAKWDAHD
ncbi:DUF202 domain-containing protein [Acidithiobacillus sp. HP-6]|nr:DUF202 domain-containing protein [Acidithiobacillus sp. HP-6]MBE7569437.1 DUF202 domain-containing protein [Acidithiobacillus sp. HP-2]